MAAQHTSYSRIPANERFWPKAVIGDGCWEWTGAKANGYGRFFVGPNSAGPRLVNAHRFAYESLVGPIPSGLTLDHLCRNRACVNPAHLEPVSNRINILRGESLSAQRARVTRCIHGHEYTPQNTHYRRNGTRKCRVCMEKKLAQYMASKT